MTNIDTSPEAVEWQARHFDHLAALYKSEANKDDATRWDQAAALLRQLAKERDELEAAMGLMFSAEEVGKIVDKVSKARNAALEEAAKVAKMQWLYSKRELISDADREMELCEEIETAILNLKTTSETAGSGIEKA